MMPKANGTKSTIERERRRFRFSLIKDILRCEMVRTLSSDDKKWLFSCLSSAGDNIVAGRKIEKMPETSRIRALEKTASNARRIQASLKSLETMDAASLNVNYERSIPLSTRLLMLEELEHDAAELAKKVKGQQKEIAQLMRRQMAKKLVKTLCGLGISCRTRNDHDVDDHNVTTAMRCAMFSMLEAETKELSWSSAASIIKLGLRTREELRGHYNFNGEIVTREAAEYLHLVLLVEPVWNGIGLTA